MSAGLEIRGAATGLLDDPLLLRLRGGAGDEGVFWRARYRDDDARVWRAAAERPQDLAGAWELGKPGDVALAALQSLRPVGIDVRAEVPDGRAVNRTLTRRLLGEGVRVRRWRDGLTASLYLPAAEQPCATVVIDATAVVDATAPRQAAVATLAAALLASRGVLALVVACGRAREPAEAVLLTARERLSSVPRASADIRTLSVLDPLLLSLDATSQDVVVLPPGVGLTGGADGAAGRAKIWDDLLGRLGAHARESF
jgi:hypothetical protein